MWTPLDGTRINQKRPGTGMCKKGEINMSLQDDINTVRDALKGSSLPEWPEPTKGEWRYPAFQAFWRICDQMPKSPVPHSNVEAELVALNLIAKRNIEKET